MKNLENWSVTLRGDYYTPPEACSKCLQGLNEDGFNIVTSPIVAVNGRVVTTYSGSVYLLGTVDPNYLDWLKDNNMPYDEVNPIKHKSSKR